MKPLYTKLEFDSTKNEEKLPCQCYECEKVFFKTKHHIKDALKENSKYSVNYCSQICARAKYKTKIKINCEQCNKEFEKFPCEIKKTKHNFCSNSCSAIYRNSHKTTGNRRSKLEIYLENQLIKLYPETKILFNDKTAINSELDIHFVDLNLAFELNGIFHYEPIFGEDKLNKIQNNDNRKFQACLEKGIELCVIDSSSVINFKEKKGKKYLDIIINIISQKQSKVEGTLKQF